MVERIFKPHKKSLEFEEIPSHKMTLGYIVDQEGKSLDEVLICPMKAPYTYTKEDLVEIYCHGGVMAVHRVFDLILSMGARVAEPGEFTKRAFLNGRIDLAQAEAVLDIIRSRSQTGVDIALKQLSGRLSGVVESLREELKGILVRVEAEIDFPDDVEGSEKNECVEKIRGIIEKIEPIIESADVGRIYREGLAAVLVGKPNTGKSTLLNRLLGEQRAIVTDIPGTTRDIIEEAINIKGIALRLLDTAGVRMNAGMVEKLGIEKTKEAVERADIVIALFDRTSPLQEDDRMVLEIIKGKHCIVLLNKTDVPDKKLDKKDIMELVGDVPVIEISAYRGWGIEEMKNAVVEIVGAQRVTGEAVMITNARHKEALERIRKSLNNALRAFDDGVPLDCIAVDLWEAWDCLGEITGATASEEIIDKIFENFCIGK